MALLRMKIGKVFVVNKGPGSCWGRKSHRQIGRFDGEVNFGNYYENCNANSFSVGEDQSQLLLDAKVVMFGRN